MSDFDESKVNRVPKGSSEGGRFTSSDGNGGTHKATPAESKRLAELGITQARLSKQELAMFYDRIGKIKKEGHYVPKTEKGDMLIPIETKDSNVLVIASGTYQNPKIKLAVRCKSNAHLYKIIDKLENL